MRYYNSMDYAYDKLVQNVHSHGMHYKPRGKHCVELRPDIFCITQPRAAIYGGRTRALNYRFLALEALTLIAGWGEQRRHAELLCAVNPNMKSYVNEQTGLFDGAYGPRLWAALPSIFQQLEADPFSRQCVASIWEPSMLRDSINLKSKDLPCTLSLHFLMDGHPHVCPSLGMVATMRSNDLNWGTPYDVASFAALQCAMADCLGWQLGRYTHVAGSLHLYTDENEVEKPPKVAEYRRETFTNLLIPTIAEPMPWRLLQEFADVFLIRAYIHFCIDKQPAAAFSSDLEKQELNGSYWKGWADLIRFSWKSWDLEQANARS